ncbi:MAG: hypothetical protein JRJ77_17400 [Deltaproteobacteria bacterium]|nr:hypothetical protein [Deltaproteobacteria bacterium]
MHENLTETIAKMVQSLPQNLQLVALEEFKRIIEEKRDEAKWDQLFERTRERLVAKAKEVKREIKAGKTSLTPL